MRASVGSLTLWGSLAFTIPIVPGDGKAQEHPVRPARAIPGITAADSFPNACVSCHVVLPSGVDVRISTLMQQWNEGVDSTLLAMAEAASRPGVILAGRHPRAMESTRNIPAGCLSCHGRTSSDAPPFAKLLHRIHLGGGPQSIYLTAFQGECTYCHKLDSATGTWSIPSGPEP